MVGRIISLGSFGALTALFLLLASTTPSDIGPIGLLAVFFLLYVALMGGVTFLLWWGSRIATWVAKPLASKRPLQRLSVSRSYYYSSVLALAPVMMLAMQSIGSLGLYEVVLVLIFLTIGVLYIAKRTS